jgi:hypothetical protein
MDLFELNSFEVRLSFLAQLFDRTRCPNSFLQLAAFLLESSSLFVFSSHIMSEIFSIIERLSSSLDDSSQVFEFVRPAITVIEISYLEFTGESIGLSKPQLFEAQGVVSGDLSRIDTDLSSNPAASHTAMLKCARAAFSFLGGLHWKDLGLQPSEFNYLFSLSLKLVNLFPEIANSFVGSLLANELIHPSLIASFVESSLRVSVRHLAVFSLCALIAMCTEKIDAFQLKRFESDEFVKSIHLMVRFCRDVPAAVEKFFASIGVELPEKVVQHEQQTVTPVGGETGPEPLTVQEAPKGLLACVQSLTPFFLRKLTIPEELFQSPLIISFCQFSEYRLNKQEWQLLFEKAIGEQDPLCVKAVLERGIKNEIQFDLRSLLDQAIFENSVLFPVTLRFLAHRCEKFVQLTETELGYVKKVAGSDVLNFILQSYCDADREISLAILRLDVDYFADQMTKLPNIKKQQIANLIYFVSEVNFPIGDFFWFLCSLLSSNLRHRKRRQLSRRLIAVYLQFHSHELEIMRTALTLVRADLGPESDLFEHYYWVVTMVNSINCQSIILFLNKVLPVTICVGAFLHLLATDPTDESIQFLLSSPVPSMHLLPFQYFSSNISKLTPHILEIMLHAKPVRTWSTQSVIMRFAEQFLRDVALMTSPEFSLQLKCELHQFLLQNIDQDVNSGFLKSFLQIEFTFVQLSREGSLEARNALKKAAQLFRRSVVPLEACQLLCESARMIQQPQHAIKVTTAYLSTRGSYQIHLIAENAAVFAWTNGIDSGVSTAKSFFAIWCAAAKLARVDPDGRHEIKRKFPPNHDIALNMLADPVMKIFSPVFALRDGEQHVSRDLSEYIATIIPRLTAQ